VVAFFLHSDDARLHKTGRIVCDLIRPKRFCIAPMGSLPAAKLFQRSLGAAATEASWSGAGNRVRR
jgi:hypothetical protein